MCGGGGGIGMGAGRLYLRVYLDYSPDYALVYSSQGEG